MGHDTLGNIADAILDCEGAYDGHRQDVYYERVKPFIRFCYVYDLDVNKYQSMSR